MGLGVVQHGRIAAAVVEAVTTGATARGVSPRSGRSGRALGWRGAGGPEPDRHRSRRGGRVVGFGVKQRRVSLCGGLGGRR